MQIIFWPRNLTILSTFVIWPILQFSMAGIANALGDRFYNWRKFFFRSHAWEKGGEIYDRYLLVRRWKGYLPDGSALSGNGYRKRRLSSYSTGNLEKYLVESCRAETAHWLAICPFWLFGFLASETVLPYMLLYALAVNLPCIIAQRFNRPRIVRILQKR